VFVHLMVLGALAFAVYANNFHHAYLLDSTYSIEQNPYVRSLSYVPRYFTDPQTLTVYRANADYRPILQLTYALNYALSGYATASWHFVQILLHLICAVALYFFCRILLAYGGRSNRTAAAPDTAKPDTPASAARAPEGPAPEGPAPEGPAPEGRAPEGSAPEGPAPEGPAPEGPVPDDPAPEGPAPDASGYPGRATLRTPGRRVWGEREGWITIPLLVAVLFVVHPTGSGVVNYLHARSALLTAAFLLPSFVLYLKHVVGNRDGVANRSFLRTPYWPVVALYTLALFTKVSAVAALAVYFLFETLGAASRRRLQSDTAGDAAAPSAARRNRHTAKAPLFLRDVFNAANGRTLRRLWPFAVVTVVYFAIRWWVLADYVAAARHSENIGPYSYLCTQLTAGWYYVYRWLAPVQLVADHAVYPVFDSLFAPAVLLAVAGWTAFAVVLLLHYRTHPHHTILALSALALLSPTSSVVPLAEMVNEHRPYLPMALFSLVGLVPLMRYVGRRLRLAQRKKRLAFLSAATLATVVLWAAALAALTVHRNRVFSTAERYYRDLVEKAPSARAHVNYGRTLTAKGEHAPAMKHYKEALALAPQWHIAHLNMATAYQRRKDTARAAHHYNRAVATERYGGIAREYRGFFHLERKAYNAALKDFKAALPLCVDCFRAYRGLSTAQAGLGQVQQVVAGVKKLIAMDRERAEKIIAPVSAPFWERGAAGRREALAFYSTMDAFLPGRWWIKQNLANLARGLGRPAAARRYQKAAAALKAKQSISGP
jgi:tetratricopeptide (TPR) repeat protein